MRRLLACRFVSVTAQIRAYRAIAPPGRSAAPSSRMDDKETNAASGAQPLLAASGGMMDDGVGDDPSGGGMPTNSQLTSTAVVAVPSASSCRDKDGISFECNKCRRKVFEEEMNNNRKGSCTKCALNYKSLTDRWKIDKQLKEWWSRKSDGDKRSWYLSRQETQLGLKRKFDSAAYQESSCASAHAQTDEVDSYIPYRVFLRDNLASGKEVLAIEKEWKDFIETNRGDCRHIRGQWLMPQFEGLKVVRGKKSCQEMRAIGQAEVTSADQLARLRNDGATLLSEYAAHIPVPQMPTLQDPIVTAHQGEMQRAMQAPDVIADAIALEVTLADALKY